MNKARIENEVLIDKVPLSVLEISQKWFEKDKNGKKGNRAGHKTLLKVYSIVKYKYEKEIMRRERKHSKICVNQIYVHLSSSYFEKVFNKEYLKYLNFWKNHKIILSKMRVLDDYEGKTDLWEDSKIVEPYKVGEYSKSYRLTHFRDSEFAEMRYELKFKNGNVSQKNIDFLLSIGIDEPKITTDNYGFRVYHTLSTTYKKILPQKGSFFYYDIKTSIPCIIFELIEELLKKQGILHDPFLDLFDGYFYDNWNTALELNFENKSDLKKSFSTIVYGQKKDVSPLTLNKIRSKFPLFFSILNPRLGKKLVRIERKFVLDKVVKNLPVDEVLTLHDGFIVGSEFESEVDQYISSLNLPKTFELVKSLIEYKGSQVELGVRGGNTDSLFPVS